MASKEADKFMREVWGVNRRGQPLKKKPQEGEGLIANVSKKAFQLIANGLRKNDPRARPLKFGELHAGKGNFMGPGTRIDMSSVRNYPPYNQADAVAKQHDLDYWKIDKQQKRKKITEQEAMEQRRVADNKMIKALKALPGDSLEKRLGLKGIQTKKFAEDTLPTSLVKELLGDLVGQKKSSKENIDMEGGALEDVLFDMAEDDKDQDGGAFEDLKDIDNPRAPRVGEKKKKKKKKKKKTKKTEPKMEPEDRKESEESKERRTEPIKVSTDGLDDVVRTQGDSDTLEKALIAGAVTLIVGGVAWGAKKLSDWWKKKKKKKKQKGKGDEDMEQEGGASLATLVSRAKAVQKGKGCGCQHGDGFKEKMIEKVKTKVKEHIKKAKEQKGGEVALPQAVGRAGNPIQMQMTPVTVKFRQMPRGLTVGEGIRYMRQHRG